MRMQVAASCDLYTVGDLILPNNLGFAFPSETPLVGACVRVRVRA
jgi:hypothetical protein